MILLPDHNGYFKTRGPRRIAAGRMRVPLVIENKYVLRLQRIFRAMHQALEKEVDFRMDSIVKQGHVKQSYRIAGVRIITAIRKPVSDAFDDMAEGVKRANKYALANIAPSDLRLGDQIQQFRDKNIALMENAGRVYADQVQEIFSDPNSIGRRVEDIAKDIRERADVSQSRAELIARDQTLKLNGQINQTRQENAGVTSYTWSTSHDERVREEHRELDGKVFQWSDPPEPGHPGEDFQCRCIALPVFD